MKITELKPDLSNLEQLAWQLWMDLKDKTDAGKANSTYRLALNAWDNTNVDEEAILLARAVLDE